ncbi:MAG: hypothetical protein N3F67_03095 [Acidilobaceae archaeon]|nr:hypothetical protein [Acidilobaceae archaeon]
MTGIADIISLPAALSLAWLDYYDAVWGVIALSFSLVALAATAGFPADAEARKELMEVEPRPFISLGRWWNILVKNVIIPFVFFVWWIVYWDWYKGWDAGLHYYTFPGLLILAIGGVVLYIVASRTIDKVAGEGR